VEGRTVLTDIDRFAGKERGALGLNTGRARKIDKKANRWPIYPVFREVEQKAAEPNVKARKSFGVDAEKIRNTLPPKRELVRF
jgi:hypothetical protein